MQRKEFEKHLKELRQELSQQIAMYLEDGLNKLSIRKLSQEQINDLGDEFGIPVNADFFYNFSPRLLEFLLNIQKQQWILNNVVYPPKEVGDLFASSFFPLDVPLIRRHIILEKIVEYLNTRINEYYRFYKPTVQILIEEQKRLNENESPKETQEILPTKTQIIQKEIELDSDSLEEVKTKIGDLDLVKLSNHREPNEQEFKCDYCICAKIEVLEQKGEMIKCIYCRNLFHLVCLKLSKPQRVFVCPECILPRLDPLHQLIDVLLEPKIFNTLTNSQAHHGFYVNKLNYTAEIRCLRIDGKNSEEISWPDYGELQLNGKKIGDFKPLSQNSSLKKRKDDKIKLDVIEKSNNFITIKEFSCTNEQKQTYRIHQGLNYLVGIFGIQQQNVEQFCKKMRNDQNSWMGIKQSQTFIKLYILQNQNDDVAMERIKVSLQCVYDTTIISTPARGTLCEHVQCFSLENICIMMKNVTPRKWRCPICRLLILDIQIDAYQSAILSLIKQHNLNITEISFDQHANIEDQQINQLMGQQFLSNLPEFLVTNNNRILAIEILSQKILQISNIFGKSQININKSQKKIKIESSKKPIQQPINSKGSNDEPICID